MIPMKRCALAYWLLGLCNNYGYVVMLSAAHDILARHDDKTNETSSDTSFNPGRHCNQLSTGVILLADIIPSLLVKIIAPFLPLWMNIRILLVVISAALGFILVGLSNSLLVAVLGVVCTAFSSGLGESTLLSFTVFFNDKSVLSGWSSGTGGAGFFGSLTYAGLLMLGLTPRETLFLLLIVPITMAVSFWLILVNPLNTPMDPEESTHVAPTPTSAPQNISSHSLWYKLNAIPRSLRYILPLTFVYYFEYLINQGLSELCLFENAFIDPKTQYRWYQVFYQIGVFISRSSISLIQIDKLWILAALQGVNLAYFVVEAIYRFTPSVVIVLVIILWEGLLGGLGYVNTFHNIQKEVRPEDRETVTGITSVSDSLGITLSGFSAIPLHDKICSLKF